MEGNQGQHQPKQHQHQQHHPATQHSTATSYERMHPATELYLMLETSEVCAASPDWTEMQRTCFSGQLSVA